MIWISDNPVSGLKLCDINDIHSNHAIHVGVGGSKEKPDLDLIIVNHEEKVSAFRNNSEVIANLFSNTIKILPRTEQSR